MRRNTVVGEWRAMNRERNHCSFLGKDSNENVNNCEINRSLFFEEI